MEEKDRECYPYHIRGFFCLCDDKQTFLFQGAIIIDSPAVDWSDVVSKTYLSDSTT